MVLNDLDTVFDAIGGAYPQAKVIYGIIGAILSYLVFHKKIYRVLGFFFTRKFSPAKQMHKYAVVIAARNEEKVIGNLLDSIANQDYPKELLTVFFVWGAAQRLIMPIFMNTYSNIKFQEFLLQRH